MTWILILEPFTECAQSVRIRTDTTLDQNCVLKATVKVCTACMDVSLLTTCMNFNTPPLAPFRESNAEVTMDTKLSKHVCHVCQLKAFMLQSVEATTTAHVPSQPVPDKASALSYHPRASLGF